MEATDPTKLDDGIKRYLAGQTVYEAAAGAGVSSSVLHRAMKARGVPARQRRIDLDAPDLIPRYLAGESELALATSFGVDRKIIRRHLVGQGVEPRGRCEAQANRAAQMTTAERCDLTAAANAAARGVPQPEERLVKSARTRETSRLAMRSDGELAMEQWLRDLGEDPAIEKAEGRYNIDLAIASVAVEVLGGKWHRYKATHATRTKALLDAGWHVVFAWNTELWPLSRAAANEVHAFAEEARSKPSAVREYRVIRGDGQLIATGRADRYDLTRIPSANSLSTRRRPNQGVA